MAEAGGKKNSTSHQKRPRVSRCKHVRGSPPTPSPLVSPPGGASRVRLWRGRAPCSRRPGLRCSLCSSSSSPLPAPPASSSVPNPAATGPARAAGLPALAHPRAHTHAPLDTRAPAPRPRRAPPDRGSRVGAASLLGDWREPEPPRGRRPHHGLSPSAPRESVRPGSARTARHARGHTRARTRADTHVRDTPSPTAALASGKSRAPRALPGSRAGCGGDAAGGGGGWVAGPSDGAGTGGACDDWRAGSRLPGSRKARGVGAGWRGAGTPKSAGASSGAPSKSLLVVVSPGSRCCIKARSWLNAGTKCGLGCHWRAVLACVDSPSDGVLKPGLRLFLLPHCVSVFSPSDTSACSCYVSVLTICHLNWSTWHV